MSEVTGKEEDMTTKQFTGTQAEANRATHKVSYGLAYPKCRVCGINMAGSLSAFPCGYKSEEEMSDEDIAVLFEANAEYQSVEDFYANQKEND